MQRYTCKLLDIIGPPTQLEQCSWLQVDRLAPDGRVARGAATNGGSVAMQSSLSPATTLNSRLNVSAQRGASNLVLHLNSVDKVKWFGFTFLVPLLGMLKDQVLRGRGGAGGGGGGEELGY